jgi:hypothetical protein
MVCNLLTRQELASPSRQLVDDCWVWSRTGHLSTPSEPILDEASSQPLNFNSPNIVILHLSSFHVSRLGRYALQSHQTKGQQRHARRLASSLDGRRSRPSCSLRHGYFARTCMRLPSRTEPNDSIAGFEARASWVFNRRARSGNSGSQARDCARNTSRGSFFA